jgi:hypothetical protein
VSGHVYVPATSPSGKNPVPFGHGLGAAKSQSGQFLLYARIRNINFVPQLSALYKIKTIFSDNIYKILKSYLENIYFLIKYREKYTSLRPVCHRAVY